MRTTAAQAQQVKQHQDQQQKQQQVTRTKQVRRSSSSFLCSNSPLVRSTRTKGRATCRSLCSKLDCQRFCMLGTSPNQPNPPLFYSSSPSQPHHRGRATDDRLARSGFFPREQYHTGIMIPAVLDDTQQNGADESGWEHTARTAARSKGDNSYRFMLLRRNQTEAGDAIMGALVLFAFFHLLTFTPPSLGPNSAQD